MRTIDELGISNTPWEVVRVTRQKEAVIKASDNAIVATMHADNASLIAAAPELYECLRMAYLHMLGKYDYKGCEVQLFKKALEKARGEETSK